MATAAAKLVPPVTHPGHTLWQREQVRAVGTAFLRIRPFVVAVGIALNALALSASGAPSFQRTLVLCCMSALWLGFVAEAWALRHRTVTERWLLLTLALTFVALCAACAMTGGVRSPILPLLFAPIGVAFAAYGQTRAASLGTAVAVLALAALCAIPSTPHLPPIREPWDGLMTVVSAAITLVLLRVGVAGLAGAHAASSDKLERLRANALFEARQRALQSEALGARVAHELRNPLTAIKGLLQLLERATGDDTQHKRVRVALDEVERLQHILEGYLSFSRTPAEPTRAPVQLDALLRDLALLVEPAADAQGVRVVTRPLPLVLTVDAVRLKDAILNLIDNALAAMPRGGELSIAVEQGDDLVAIRITDTGSGMSRQQLQDAGTPFLTQRPGGTGLGVAIARGIARQHGGDLVLHSTQGSGTTATLSVRIEPEARS